jgi:hypothetical protein
MAICPNDGQGLTALEYAGGATYYVCQSGCGKHFMGTGGILLPQVYVKGAKASGTSSLTYVTHGLYRTPVDGDITVSRCAANAASGASLYVTGYSSTNFSVTFDGAAVATSGVSFVWKYSAV